MAQKITDGLDRDAGSQESRGPSVTKHMRTALATQSNA
jgi:hypothetical protein